MIRIGGMTPLTSIDFPGHLAAVLYLQGCPWRCGYCHNPELIPARSEVRIGWEEVLAFLQRRRGLLDGVVFSGGEPTSQAELLEAIASVQNPLRPGRREPRAKKRRPKSYQLLTKPRHKFKEIPPRERYRVAA